MLEIDVCQMPGCDLVTMKTKLNNITSMKLLFIIHHTLQQEKENSLQLASSPSQSSAPGHLAKTSDLLKIYRELSFQYGSEQTGQT